MADQSRELTAGFVHRNAPDCRVLSTPPSVSEIRQQMKTDHEKVYNLRPRFLEKELPKLCTAISALCREQFSYERLMELADGKKNFFQSQLEEANKEGIECSICYQSLEPAKTIGFAQCLHFFCDYCAKKSFTTKKQCAICRCPVPNKDSLINMESILKQFAMCKDRMMSSCPGRTAGKNGEKKVEVIFGASADYSWLARESVHTELEPLVKCIPKYGIFWMLHETVLFGTELFRFFFRNRTVSCSSSSKGCVGLGHL